MQCESLALPLQPVAFGPHALPLIGHADWNDCLNLNCFSKEPNESFQTLGDVEGSKAESVMIAGLFLYACKDLSALYRFLKQENEATRIDGYHAEMLAIVESQAWDGDWYLRAFYDDGAKMGSHESIECQIDSIAQSWAVLSGAADPDGGRFPL